MRRRCFLRRNHSWLFVRVGVMQCDLCHKVDKNKWRYNPIARHHGWPLVLE